MLQGIRGFLGRATGHMLGSLNRHLMHRVAGPSPVGLEDLLKICQSSQNPERVADLRGRLVQLLSEPENHAIRQKIESWIQKIEMATDEDLLAAIREIQLDVQDTIVVQKPIFGHISTQIGQTLNQVFKTAPDCVVKAHLQLSRKNLNLPFDREHLLLHLNSCRERDFWDDRQLGDLSQAILCLESGEGNFDWRNLQEILAGKESELHGAILISSDQIRSKTQLFLNECLNTIGYGLFRNADPVRNKIELSMDIIRRATLAENPHLNHPDLFNHLANLILTARTIFIDDRQFQANVDDLELLCRQKESNPEEPVIFLQRAYRCLQNFLPFFESAGIAVKIYETVFSTFFTQKNEQIISTTHLPYNRSHANLIELPSSPFESPRGDPKTRLLLPIGDSCQIHPREELNCDLLIEALRPWADTLKTDLFCSLTGSTSTSLSLFSKRRKPFSQIKGEVCRNFVRGDLHLLVPLKEVLAERFEPWFDAICNLLFTKWIPRIYTNLQTFLDTSSEISVAPLKKLNLTIRQLSLDIQQYSTLLTVTSRDEYLKHKRLEVQSSWKNTLKVHWRISGILSREITDDFSYLKLFRLVVRDKRDTLKRLYSTTGLKELFYVADVVTKKCLELLLRIFLMVLPYQRVMEALTDKFLTSKNLIKIYRSCLESLLDDYRKGTKSHLNKLLGANVDPNASKELVKSILEIFLRNSGMDSEGLKNNPFMQIPSLLRALIYEKGGEKVAMLWGNVVTPEFFLDLQKSLIQIIKTAHTDTSFESLDLQKPVDLSLVDLEHAICVYLVRDLTSIEVPEEWDRGLEYIKKQILSLPVQTELSEFVPYFEKLKREVTNLIQQQNSPLFGLNLKTITQYLNEINDLVESQQDPSEKIGQFKIEIAQLKQDLPQAKGKMKFMEQILIDAFQLGFIHLREWMLDKELFKRVLADQLLPI
jgi:hypothetical protein